MKSCLKNRWVLLEHIAHPEDQKGFHFDLLIEDKDNCRTWRLHDFPVLDGPALSVFSIAPHKLYWLERRVGLVSGGRGWVYRLIGGQFKGTLPGDPTELIKLDLIQNGQPIVILEIFNTLCKFRSVQSQNLIR